MKRDFVSKEEYKGYYITTEMDDNPEDPRQWDNLTVMVTKHHNYRLGDRKIGGGGDTPYIDTAQGFENWLFNEGKKGRVYSLPLYLYDHSGISMSTQSFIGRAVHAEWDSGKVGYIYITREIMEREFGWRNVSEQRRQKIYEIMVEEVAEYDRYLRGEAYGFATWTADPVENEKDADEIDSTWGYGSEDDAVADAKNIIDFYVRKELQHGLQLTLPHLEEHLPQQVRLEREKLDTPPR